VFGPENYIRKWDYTNAVGLQGNVQTRRSLRKVSVSISEVV